MLFDGSDGRNYMVHASRREKPAGGVHTKDADIIYVLRARRPSSPAAKLLTVRPPRPTNCAAAASGGQTRQIAKGDVVIVPHGVPHQFMEVTNPFLYYVVKVR